MPTFTTPDGSPAALSPAEQSEALQLAQQPAPAPTLLPMGKAPQLLDPATGQPANLSPDESRQARQAAGVIDPLQDMTPQEMSELAHKEPKAFTPLQAFLARPDLQSNPDVVRNAAEAHRLYKDTTGALEGVTPSSVASSIGGFFKGIGKWGLRAAETPIGAMLPDEQLDAQGLAEKRATQQKLAEAASGTAVAATSLANQIGNVFRSLYNRAQAVAEASATGETAKGSATQFKTPGQLLTPDQKVQEFLSDVAHAKQLEEIARGHAGDPVFHSLTAGGDWETTIANLEKEGYALRPEEVSQYAAGDPITAAAFGKAFGAASKLGAAVLPADAIEAGLKAAGAQSAKAVGKTIEKLGTGLDVTGKGLQKSAPIIGTIGGVVKATQEAFAGEFGKAAESLALGPLGGKGVGEVAALARKAAPALKKFGQEVASGENVTSAGSQAVRDALQVTPIAGAELAKGVAMDLGLAATGETPEEKAGVGLGTVFGGLGAAGRFVPHVVSGQIVGPRDWGSDTVVNSNGYFDKLDPIHQQGYSQAPQGVRRRVNSVRAVLKSIDPNADFIYAPKPAEGQPDTLPQQLVEQGVTPETAQLWANQEGLASHQMPNGKTLVLARDISAAPHEAVGHGLENVLGESIMRQMDQLIQSDPTYQRNWEPIAQNYTRALGWDGTGNWQDFLLDKTGWGQNYAKEKAAFQSEPTGPLTPEQADAAYQKAGGDWRTILSPSEKAEAADSYISREIFAENADALFKRTGPSLQAGGIPMKIAQTLAAFTQALGAEPLAGRTSEGLGIPLSSQVIEAVQKGGQARQAREPFVAPKLKISKPGTPMPVTPEQQQQAADEARQAALAAPTTPVAGGTQSPREILGAMAEAIASRLGVKLNYLSAPDEPAAALSMNRKVRRAMIEIGRTLPPAARSLWEKNFFPERVLQNKDGSFQVSGWAPEVFAANVHRTAQELNRLGRPELMPYPIDPKTGSLTTEGWQQLYGDVQTAIRNYTAGRTASGEEITVPPSAVEAGAVKPPIRGTAEPLNQGKADFINAMFGLKLPKTTRISTKELGLPTTIVGEDISRATMPGRVEPPVVPRGTFEGPKAEALGIGGRELMEVNPWRNAAERAGFDPNQLIEARQNLNVGNIKEAAVAPEQPQFRANTLTLQAGFMPSKDPRAVKMAAIRDERTGKIYEGPMHAVPMMEYLKELHPDWDEGMLALDAWNSHPGVTEGFTTNTPGEFLDREQAFQRATELGQYKGRAYDEGSLESTAFDRQQQLQAAGYSPETAAQYKPAESAGTADRKEVFAARKAWREKGTESPYFQRWFGGSKVVDDSGKPMVVYHGTTQKFDRFGNKLANPENSLGVGHYFTTDREDAGNYASHFGPDLRSRVARRVDELTSEGLSQEKAEQRASRELVGREERVIPAYLKIENPAILDRKYKGTNFEINYDEDTGAETGSGVDLYNSLMRVSAEHGVDGQSIWNDLITQNNLEDLSAYNVWKGIKDSEHAMDSNDPQGRLMSSEIARQVFQDLGFDGIQMNQPSEEFPGMGIDPAAKHYVAFDPEQVKGAENRGTFSQQDPRYQFKPKTFIVRHGSTEMNSTDPDKDLIRGHIDVPLDEKGRREAEKSAADIAAQGGVDHIIASDLGRTLETAAAISRATGATIEPDPGLRPWKFGPTIEGKPTSKMLPKIRELTENPDTRPPGGETFNEFKDRFLEAFHRAQAENQDKNTAIVTHYRGTKLLDAWREAGVDNDNIDKAVFEAYDQNKKPGHVDVIDKTGAQFMPETRWHGKEREGEKEHEWNELSNSLLHPKMRTPANEGQAPDVTLEQLQKEGYKTVDWAETPTFHDHMTRAVFYKSDRGQFPLTEEGVRSASEAALKQEQEVRDIAYPDTQFMPKAKTTKLTHYTTAEDLEKLDPTMHGTGLAGAELARKRDYPELYVPRSYFGTRGYEKEPGLGDVRYRAEVRSGKLYDLSNDPKDLYPSSDELEKLGYAPMDQRAALSLYEKRIRDAGYEGYINKDSKTVAKFTETPVKRAQYVPTLKPGEGPTPFPSEPEDASSWPKFSHLVGVWLSPDGKFFDASPDHYRTAEAHITGWTQEDPRELAYKKQWIRVNVDGTDSTQGILIEGPKPNPSQQRALTAAADSQELPVIRDDGRIVSGAEYSNNVSAQFKPTLTAPEPKEFKDERTLPAALAKPNWAILTATQESKGSGTEPANVKANEELEKALTAEGFKPVTVKGSYKGVDQGKNFLVTGMTPEQALDWGKRYGQESVLTPDGLLYQDNTVNPTEPTEHYFGDEAKKQDFYSQVEGGPAFSMGIDFSQRLPIAEARKATEVRGPIVAAKVSPTVARGRQRGVEEGETLSLQHVLDNPDMEGFAKKVVERIKAIPGFKNIDAKNIPAAMKEIASRMAQNIRFFYDRATPENRELWRQWYDLANKMTKEWGPEYGHHPDVVAAVNARLSPQTDWYNNVTLTRAVLDTFKDNPVFTEADRAFVKSKVKKVKSAKERKMLLKELENIKTGQHMDELNDLQAGFLMRAHNETTRSLLTHDHNLQLTGDFTGWGKPWDDLRSVVSILRNPSYENVDRELGNNHKVRSFYNNHVLPESADWTTIDTHAGAAATMMPFGSTDAATKDIFSNPKHKASGYNGTYFLYQHAYEQVAKDIGILPRELQSIVWEQIRQDLTPAAKRSLQNADFKPILDVHRRIDKGELTPAEGREEIMNIFKEHAIPTAERGRGQLDVDVKPR